MMIVGVNKCVRVWPVCVVLLVFKVVGCCLVLWLWDNMWNALVVCDIWLVVFETKNGCSIRRVPLVYYILIMDYFCAKF